MDDLPPPLEAALIARGVMRHLDRQGWVSVAEFTLASGRRADVIALDEGGRLLIVEVKTCAADFRSDRKWREYLDYCDLFAFAVPAGFPVALLPPETGLLVADGYEAVGHRPPATAPAPLAPARRRQVLLRFARVAADRLRRGLDPEDGLDGG